MDKQLFDRLVDFAPLQRRANQVRVKLVNNVRPYSVKSDEYVVVSVTFHGWFAGWLSCLVIYWHFVRMARKGRQHAATATVKAGLMAAPGSTRQLLEFRREVIYQYSLGPGETFPDVIPPGAGYDDNGLRVRYATLENIAWAAQRRVGVSRFPAR